MEVVRAGRSLLFREHPHAKPHLWFILTDPDRDPPSVVAVMVRTHRQFTDPTVILVPGDHPFIKHESSVHFSSAQLFRVSRIQRALATGQGHLLEDMTRELLSTVRNGLLESPFTVHAMRAHRRDLF